MTVLFEYYQMNMNNILNDVSISVTFVKTWIVLNDNLTRLTHFLSKHSHIQRVHLSHAACHYMFPMSHVHSVANVVT